MSDTDEEELKEVQKVLEWQKQEDPEATYRVYNVIIYIIILVGIGFPIWWMTTRVYRAPLPLNEMILLNVEQNTDKVFGVPLSLEYDLLVTFVNPSPQTLKVDIDGEMLDLNFQPFLRKLSSVANFTVKTQWLYMKSLGVAPKKIENAFVLHEDVLPLIITPLEKRLGSHLSPSPCLNLVLYFSECEKPLYIFKNEHMAPNNTFISPGWGGISIINPTLDACTRGTLRPNVKNTLAVFAKILLKLFHVKSDSTVDLAEFNLNKTHEMIQSSKRTLKSLAQLLSEINSIVISDEVAAKINLAVQYVNEAETHLKNANMGEALRVAKKSFEYSEAAFSDTSLLALLYFPDDQKYAVYIPLFLPVLIPVIMSAVTVYRWNEKRKQAKIKTE